MKFLSKAAGIAAVSLSLLGAPVLAEGFPDRPMEFVAGYGPGGGHDTMLRTMARLMEQEGIVEDLQEHFNLRPDSPEA